MNFIFILGLKITTVLGVGIIASKGMEKFHNFKFKTKRKGDSNEYNHSEFLRERAKKLS